MIRHGRITLSAIRCLTKEFGFNGALDEQAAARVGAQKFPSLLGSEEVLQQEWVHHPLIRIDSTSDATKVFQPRLEDLFSVWRVHFS